MRSRCWLRTSMAAVLLIGNLTGASDAAAGSAGASASIGALRLIDCPYNAATISAFGEPLICSQLTAPMVYGADDEGSVDLIVARINGHETLTNSVPLVVLLGGPGQEVESALLSLFSESGPSYRSLLDHRDVILIDQRGVGYSEPSLACDFDAVGGIVTPTETLDVRDPVPALARCSAELRERGVNMEAFDSRQSAADIDLLRQALGLEQIDLMGISYGTRLALTVVRDFPATVRSLILESPEPLDANVPAGQIVGFDQSLSQIFANCSAQASCSARYPDLEASFSTAVQALDDTPLTVSIADGDANGARDYVVDGQVFVSTVYLATLLTSLIPLVPALIDGVLTGQNVVLENVLPFTQGASPGISLGASYVINCNDQAASMSIDQTRALVSQAGVRSEIADGRFANVYGLFDICGALALQPAGANDFVPWTSDVPALVLTGAYDPITPPSYAQDVLRSIPKATLVTFGASSHTPLLNAGACGFGILSGFLADPDAPIDSACSAQTPIEFVILPS